MNRYDEMVVETVVIVFSSPTATLAQELSENRSETFLCVPPQSLAQCLAQISTQLMLYTLLRASGQLKCPTRRAFDKPNTTFSPSN